MATIKPFKGIRPPQDLVEQVASRPYDVLNSAEAREEAAGNEKSLYHIIKPEIDFPVGTDEHDERVYRKAAENFQMFQDKGWLVQDDKENYYIYAQTMNGKTQYGCIGTKPCPTGIISGVFLLRNPFVQGTCHFFHPLLIICSGIISQQIFKRLKISTSPT